MMRGFQEKVNIEENIKEEERVLIEMKDREKVERWKEMKRILYEKIMDGEKSVRGGNKKEKDKKIVEMEGKVELDEMMEKDLREI